MKRKFRLTHGSPVHHRVIHSCIVLIEYRNGILGTMPDPHMHPGVSDNSLQLVRQDVNDWNHLVDENRLQLRYMIGPVSKHLHTCLSKYKIQLKQKTHFQKGPQCFKEVPLTFFREILLQVEARMDRALAEMFNCCPLLKQTSKAFTMCVPSGGYQVLERLEPGFCKMFFDNTIEKLCAAGLILRRAWPNQLPPGM